MLRTGETICAPATSGRGAIAVIRISGPKSLEICQRIFFPADQKITIDSQKGYSIVYGEIRSENELIDDVLVSIFRTPHSYTGEDSIEISCHASPFIQHKVLELLIKHGALPAQPGEFTQRAFLNGKMDLSQAEAVADIIASESRSAHRIAMSQMRGEFSDEINILRADLLHFASLIELELDFGEEDVEFANRKELEDIVERVLKIASDLASSFSLGNAIKNGMPVVITGSPNTGKSTLLNTLLKEEKAIVSEIPGTTRDAIEDTAIIDGIQFRFTDTAGLRDTDDIVENLGIKKTHEKIRTAAIILLVIDINDSLVQINDTLERVRNTIRESDTNMIILINKTDTAKPGKSNEIRNNISLTGDESLLFISALTGEGIDDLKESLIRIGGKASLDSDDVIISNIRHYNALLQVINSLERVHQGLKETLQEDLIATDIRQAIHYLGEITGQITNDEILGNIFRNFCIGK
jgi:tRNA modification GTPase